MRYLLIVVGILGVPLGFSMIGSDSASRYGPLYVQTGATFLAVGLATVDIVGAFKAKRP
jgi:hypothetical protein